MKKNIIIKYNKPFIIEPGFFWIKIKKEKLTILEITKKLDMYVIGLDVCIDFINFKDIEYMEKIELPEKFKNIKTRGY